MLRILLFVALLVAVAVALPVTSPQLQESASCVYKFISKYVILGYYNIIKSIQNITRNFFNLTGDTISEITPDQLKELIASYEENFEKLINFAVKISENETNNKREIQFLKQLSSVIEQLVQEQSRIMHVKFNNTDSILQALNNVNSVKDLINTIKEIDTVYPDGEITDKHIRIKRAATFATSEEWMNNMLIDIQRQVVQIRKYLDKLCKKHHPTSTTILEVNSGVDISPVDQPNKIAIM
ncbi:hypothetical protein ALC62_01840 [Cyphomyrmex costatus]|uniref:Uncharacterized protein n=1 Tax=Cyphomyrmex costatus TaxID=456900 RepID=A0A151INX7_9HYME|nr:hypothetical protein ALC62_01840 [Cyphomyrmex costatus]